MPDPKSRSGFDIGRSLTYFQKIVKMGILVGLGIGLITGFYHLAKTIWKHKN